MNDPEDVFECLANALDAPPHGFDLVGGDGRHVPRRG